VEHAKQNRADCIRLKKQKVMVSEGPTLDPNGQPKLPLAAQFVQALKGAANFTTK
jgi:hypothetical protein